MTLSWSTRRQLLYYGVGAIIFGVLGFFIYHTLLTRQPTCFDGTQNADERGVDCGGSCALICAEDARSPVVLWARSFQVAPGYYTAAAYVQNNNVGATAERVPYSFQLFDANNVLVAEHTGSIDIPPVQTVPIIAPNVEVGSRTVARTLFAFSQIPVWEKVSEQPPAVRTTNQLLAPDGSRLSATVINDSLEDLAGTSVIAVLFDGQGVARAASRSIVRIPRKGSQQVIFTWPGGTPGVVRAEITVLPPLQ